MSYIGFNNTSTSPNQNQYPTKKQPPNNDNIDYPSVPDSLPSLPNFNNNRNKNNTANNNPTDSFDDLAARFENLKKKWYDINDQKRMNDFNSNFFILVINFNTIYLVFLYILFKSSSFFFTIHSIQKN